MSGYAYRCPVCGGGFTESDDPLMCCGAMREPYACGLPPRESGGIEAPYVIGDELHGAGCKFDWAAGQSFTSKSERKRVLEAKGLGQMSFNDARREGLLGDHPSPTMTYSYTGQRNRDTTRRWTDSMR